MASEETVFLAGIFNDVILQDLTPSFAPALNADYTFDANGNRLTRQQGPGGTEADEVYRYAAKSNRLLDKDALRQADATPEPVKDVTYDAKQRVRTLSVDGQLKAAYRYDARNLRTKKTLYDVTGTVSEEIYYHYDQNGLLIGESDAQGQVRREYVYLGRMPVAQIDIDAQGQESVVYFLTDHLATPRLGIDQGQAVVWKWESDAYGSIEPSGSVTVNLRFAGQYFDAESGWYYNWNRYYLPEEGRYLTSDPIGLAGGINTYKYAFQNPVNFVDPNGENPLALIALAAWLSMELTADTPLPPERQISPEQQFLADALAPMPPVLMLLKKPCGLLKLMKMSPYKPTQSSKRINMDYVDELAKKMKSDKFDWNNKKIIIDENGNIMDGHHKILAAAKAGVKIPDNAIVRYPGTTSRPVYRWEDVLE